MSIKIISKLKSLLVI
ncbi:predicted protein [Fibroporia radiculosa]|uniref:Uncharacterized protein n=1 Tax=Fibroporia radiculosa TaxID=599839 RepID=J7RW87_9APHY|nr:predicted protein [Fibroporia radiculosa]